MNTQQRNQKLRKLLKDPSKVVYVTIRTHGEVVAVTKH